jgi:hypothetical protein
MVEVYRRFRRILCLLLYGRPRILRNVGKLLQHYTESYRIILSNADYSVISREYRSVFEAVLENILGRKQRNSNSKMLKCKCG